MTRIELETNSMIYRTPRVHGMGISASSNFAVLNQASQLYLQNGPSISKKEIACAALRSERNVARSDAIAANDIYPITYGGVLRVFTMPNRIVRGELVDGEVFISEIDHDSQWIADHVVVAFDASGPRHRVPKLLGTLISHPGAPYIVERLSALADQACQAIAAKDVVRLATVVRDYVSTLDNWSNNMYTANALGAVSELIGQLRDQVLAWKPPGGGASRSLIVIAPDRIGRDAVLDFLAGKGWWASPALVTGGIDVELPSPNGFVRFTAGHRLDFVGGADLGQALAINKEGCCCSCAIEPRGEIVVSVANPPANREVILQ